MNYYKLFYWITVAERVQNFILAIAVVLTILTALNIILNIVGRYYVAFGGSYDSDGYGKMKKTTNRFYAILIPCFFLFWSGYLAVPSKSDTVLIIAGGAIANFATKDSSAKQIPSEMSSFVVEKIRELTREAKADLGTDPVTQKAKELDNLDADQLRKLIKTDTTISKLAKELNN